MRLLEEQLFKDGLAFAVHHFPHTNVHDRAILTYLYARRRIGAAVKGDHYRLREPLPPEAEEVLTPFRNFVRFVEAKRDGVKYDPNQPRVPAGNPDGGQWTAEGGNIGRSAESSKEPRTRNVRLAMDITGFTKHGINQAINRGVSPSGILDAIKNPISVEPRSNGSTRHV